MTGIDVESVKGPQEITDLSRQLRAKYFNGIACNYLSYGMGGPADNIERLCLDIYRYIAQWYKRETEIWLFGLGRGAYALRCVVGMINNCGIVKDPNDDLCNLVYRTYLSPCKNDKPSSAQSKDFRRRASWDVVTPIKLMVLLDTLGTIDPNTTGYATKSPTLWDGAIPSTVDKVLHACSIHDRFSLFHPCLATKAEHKASPEVHEVWFPGCHYDIGRQHCQFFSRTWLYCIPSMLVRKWQAATMRSSPWHFAGFDCSVVGQQAAARVGDDPAELLSFNLLLIYTTTTMFKKESVGHFLHFQIL